MKKSVNHPLLSNGVIVRKLVAPKLGYLPVRDRESLLKCPLWLTNFGVGSRNLHIYPAPWMLATHAGWSGVTPGG